MDRKENVNKPQAPDEEELRRLMLTEERIRNKLPKKIEIGKRIYTVRQVSKAVRSRIHKLELEAYALSGLQKEEMKVKRAQKIQRRLDRLHAKTAAYYVLGNRALWVPGLWWLTWRRMMLLSEKEVAMINDAAVNDEELGFSSANWDITKFQLALCMKPIGDGVKELLKRWESASQQVEKDATKKKEEAPTSAASSKKARITRK